MRRAGRVLPWYISPRPRNSRFLRVHAHALLAQAHNKKCDKTDGRRVLFRTVYLSAGELDIEDVWRCRTTLTLLSERSCWIAFANYDTA